MSFVAVVTLLLINPSDSHLQNVHSFMLDVDDNDLENEYSFLESSRNVAREIIPVNRDSKTLSSVNTTVSKNSTREASSCNVNTKVTDTSKVPPKTCTASESNYGHEDELQSCLDEDNFVEMEEPQCEVALDLQITSELNTDRTVSRNQLECVNESDEDENSRKMFPDVKNEMAESDVDSDSLEALVPTDGDVKIADIKTESTATLDNSECVFMSKFYPQKFSKSFYSKMTHPEELRLRPFLCQVCNIGFAKHGQYVRHQETIGHQQKKKIQSEIKGSGVRDDIMLPTNLSGQPRRIRKRNSKARTSELDSSTTESSEESDGESERETEYNLRSRKTPSAKKSTGGSNNQKLCSKSNNAMSADQRFRVKQLSCSKPKKVKFIRNSRIRRLQIKRWRCFKEGCKYQTEIEMAHKVHQKLPAPGEYKCMFCEVLEGNALKIALHEERKHCNRERAPCNFYCSRCPYKTQLRFKFIHHFAQIHLGFPELREVCPICKVTVVNKDKHFAVAHDVSKTDPKNVIKCKYDDCTAYFVSIGALVRHRRQVHAESVFTNNIKDRFEGMAFKCRLCQIGFLTQVELIKHRRSFHSLKAKDAYDDPKHWKSQLLQHGYIICQESNCNRKFKQLKLLREHSKLHGIFKCQFCETVKKFAPELPLHELEHDTEETGSDNLKCSRCSFITKHESVLVTHHLAAHLKLSTEGFVCHVCCNQFKSVGERASHFKNAHGFQASTSDSQNLHRCNQCPAYFLKQFQLLKHLDLIHKHKCLVGNCKAEFETRAEWEGHSKWHGTFKCLFCDATFNLPSHLAKHEMKEHVPEKMNPGSLKCSRCNYSCVSNPTRCTNHFVTVHLQLKLEEGIIKLHRCPFCSQTSERKGHIALHINKVHGVKGTDKEKLHQCLQCSATFVKAVQLSRHQRNVHQNHEIGTFMCKYCNKMYKSKFSLRVHQSKFHANDSNFKFVCDFPNCKKGFDSSDDLEHHKLRARDSRDHCEASDDKKLQCDKCERQFFNVNGLKIHMASHARIKPTEYKCNECDKVFKGKAGLQAHELFHKGPEHWQFMCSICSKKCVTKNVLQSHMRTHTKEKPFVCQVCGEKYAHRHNLRNHVNSKHKDDGVQDIPRKNTKRFYVSRKGKKLGTEFCFTKEQDKQADISSD